MAIQPRPRKAKVSRGTIVPARRGDAGKRITPAPEALDNPNVPAHVTCDNYGTSVQHPKAKYTPELARELCLRLMCEPVSLRKVCMAEDMPTRKTVGEWLGDPEKVSFRMMYYNARRVQAELRMDDAFDIAEPKDEDWKEIVDKNGDHVGWRPDNTTVQRDRTRIDLIKWYAVKMVPDMYGDTTEVKHGVTGELARLIKQAQNQDRGLPPPIDVTPE